MLLFVGFILIATSKYGIATTADSITYFSAATGVASGQGFVLYDGSYYRDWPPLYPLILSLSIVSKIPLLFFAKMLNCLTFMLTVFLGHRFFSREVKGDAVYIGTAMIACSYILFKLNIICYTEPLFILFFTAFLFFFISYLQNSENRHLYLSAFFISLMCVQRYAGLMCLIWVVPFLWFNLSGNGQFKKVFLFTLIAVFPVSFWALRNYWLNKELLGQHRLSDKINVSAFVENISALSHSVSSFKEMLVCSSIIATLLVWSISFVLVLKMDKHAAKRNVLVLLWILCSGYGILILLQSKLQVSELPRYLSIVYIPFLFYVMLWIEHLVKGNNGYKAAKYAMIAFVVIQGAAVAVKAVAVHQKGNGYETAEWREGDAISFIRNGLPSGNLISNYPDFIWLVQPQPVKLSMSFGEDNETFYKRTAGAEYFLWIEIQKRPSCINPENYQQGPYKLTLIAKGNQYRLFKISKS